MKRTRSNQKSRAAIARSAVLVGKWLKTYERVIEKYEQEHPHWRIEVLVSLIKWSLQSLKHYIENPRESKISWADPFVELHFPVGWDWSAREEGDAVSYGHQFGQITSKNVATEAKAHQTLARIMVEQLNAMTLAETTNWAYYEKRNNYFTPVLPIETTAKLVSIKGKRARREAFDELVRPFSIGASRVDASVLKLKSGQRVPKRLLESQPQMDIPGIRFAGDVNGRKIDMGLIFEIHPLIADYDQKKAYHPVVVGLAVLNGNARIVDGDFLQDAPATWTKVERKKLWDELLSNIENLAAALIPKPEAEASVILSVNSQLKVPESWWRPENRTATMKFIADAQGQVGEMVGFGVQEASFAGKQLTQTCRTCGWVHDAGFTQLRVGDDEISLGGLLPDIVQLVHRAHEKGLAGMNTKDEQLVKLCGGYRNPCKAFDDLGRRAEYKLIFDTRKRGFIALRGRNKSESNPE